MFLHALLKLFFLFPFLMQNEYRYHRKVWQLNFSLITYKNYLDYLPGRLKYTELGKSSCLEFQCQKLMSVYHNTYILLFCIHLSPKPYQGLWFNRTHLLLFQKLLCEKINISFFVSSGGYNFKINYLKDKMRHGMWVHILLNNLALSPLQVLL